MEISDIANREERVRQHLIFIEDGIKHCGVIPAVLHGTVLAPQGSLITKGPKKGYSSVGQVVEDSFNLAKIEELLVYLRENNIEIHTCPTANTNSQRIAMYRGHPLHQWLIRGNKVSINVDDFYWGSVRTTLSDDIAKMMLAAPVRKDTVILTPQVAQHISQSASSPASPDRDRVQLTKQVLLRQAQKLLDFLATTRLEKEAEPISRDDVGKVNPLIFALGSPAPVAFKNAALGWVEYKKFGLRKFL